MSQKEKNMKLSTWLVLVGSIFVAVVSLIAAFSVEDMVLMALLVLSTLVSLVIAVWEIYYENKMTDEINKLKEDKQDKLVFASKETCESIIDELT